MTLHPTTEHIPWENHNSKRHMYPSVYWSNVYNGQDMEETKMSIDRGKDKEVVIHIYNGILTIKRNEFWVILKQWMNVEPVYRVKSGREKQISYINSYIWNLEKWYWWTYLQGKNRDMDSPDDAVVKNLTASAGGARDTSVIPELERSPGVGNSNPFQYSWLENSMDRGGWQATVHGVTKSQHNWAHTHNGDTDVEKEYVNTMGEGEGRTNWESSIDIYTLLCVK